jgi:uncharacterized protein YxeA
MGKIEKRGQSPLSGLNKTVNVAEIIKEETLSEPVVEEPVVYQKEPVSRTVTPTKSKKDEIYDVYGGNKKVKYTATMAHIVRSEAKIAAMKQGVTFSEFVEEAVIRHLRLMGVKL